MKSFTFDPEQSFREVKKVLAELNQPENKELIAKVTWLEGSAKGASLTFLWDPMAERFGHSIDKELIDTRVVDSLINDISVEVTLLPHTPIKHHEP